MGGAAVAELLARVTKQPAAVGESKKGRVFIITSNEILGKFHPEGYRKALRLMKQAESLAVQLPFINTAGAFFTQVLEPRNVDKVKQLPKTRWK